MKECVTQYETGKEMKCQVGTFLKELSFIGRKKSQAGYRHFLPKAEFTATQLGGRHFPQNLCQEANEQQVQQKSGFDQNAATARKYSVQFEYTQQGFMKPFLRCHLTSQNNNLIVCST